MAQASDQMIDALESLLETLKDITLALEPRDIDLSRAAESRELTWPPAARKPAKFP